MNEETPILCGTCRGDLENFNIRVRDMNIDPPAEYFFCAIFCRNVFINSNKDHIRLDKDYGNTLARIGTGIA